MPPIDLSGYSLGIEDATTFDTAPPMGATGSSDVGTGLTDPALGAGDQNLGFNIMGPAPSYTPQDFSLSQGVPPASSVVPYSFGPFDSASPPAPGTASGGSHPPSNVATPWLSPGDSSLFSSILGPIAGGAVALYKANSAKLPPASKNIAPLLFGSSVSVRPGVKPAAVITGNFSVTEIAVIGLLVAVGGYVLLRH